MVSIFLFIPPAKRTFHTGTSSSTQAETLPGAFLMILLYCILVISSRPANSAATRSEEISEENLATYHLSRFLSSTPSKRGSRRILHPESPDISISDGTFRPSGNKRFIPDGLLNKNILSGKSTSFPDGLLNYHSISEM